MQDVLLRKVQAYLLESLNLTVKPVAWEGVALPIYLLQDYELYLVKLINNEYLFACHNPNAGDTPALLNKQLTKIEEVTGYRVILLANEVTSYNRKRWIEQKISFIVPGNQLFLPELGLDLREYFRSATKKSDSVSPSTQCLIIYALLNREYLNFTTSYLKEKTGYTPMTLKRIFDELLEHRLAKAESVNLRERAINFVLQGKELWDIANPMLKSPVSARKWIRCNIPLGAKYKLAGLTALAMQTMLAEPEIPVIAMTNDEYKLGLQSQEFQEVRDSWKAMYQVEIWRYNPKIVSKDTTVDSLSLFLSLTNERDARTLGEIEAMMEKLAW